MQRLDLAGRRSNRIVAVRTVGSGANGVLWSCLCDCGNTLVVPAAVFRKRVSCGCAVATRDTEATAADAARLFSRALPAENGCLEWQGQIDKFGYGKFDRHRSAHRVAYAVYHGVAPRGLVVRHKCDNPRCVREDHIELGTQAENAEDMARRGRSKKGIPNNVGEASPLAKLREPDVLEILRRRAAGEARAPLAAQFGVCLQTITDIVHGRAWSHITRKAS